MSPSVPKPPKSERKARKPVKRQRATPRRQVGKCPELLAWIHTQPCWITGLPDGFYLGYGVWVEIEAAHLPRTKRLGGDLWNVIPLRSTVHRAQHQLGIKTWLAANKRTMNDLKQAAHDYTEKFFAETGVPRPHQETP